MTRTAKNLVLMLLICSTGCIAGPTPFPLNDANTGSQISDMGYLGSEDVGHPPESCEWDDQTGAYAPPGCEPTDPSSDVVISDGDVSSDTAIESDGDSDVSDGDVGPDGSEPDGSNTDGASDSQETD